MGVEYDLVVVGATAAARTAAIAAAQAHARVAWVPNGSGLPDLPMLMREGARRFVQLKRGGSPEDWLNWTDTLLSALSTNQFPSQVQSYGVDYREGSVLFQQNTVSVEGRSLRSRSYLLAINPDDTWPRIPGMDHPRVWTMPQLWDELRRTDRAWPQSIAVLGHGPQAVELSQSLIQLGLSVGLITGGTPLLPGEDEEVTFLLQSYLEGNGLSLQTQHELTLIEPLLNGQLRLVLGEQKYTVDALVIAPETTWALPTVLAPLNLQQTSQGIVVNRALQTSNPCVYAVGALIGGYRLPSIAQYEAKWAVNNALFEKRTPIPYHQLPYAIHSNPPLGRVGLTEVQARQYDPAVLVLRQTYGDCDHPRWDQAPVGLCKVLVQEDGTLLGAHLLGDSAADLIQLLALAIQQRIRLQDLSRLGYASPSDAEVIQRIADQWGRRQHQRDRNEHWFYHRRQRTP